MQCTACNPTLLFANRARDGLSIRVYWSHWGRSSLQKPHEMKIGISGEWDTSCYLFVSQGWNSFFFYWVTLRWCNLYAWQGKCVGIWVSLTGWPTMAQVTSINILSLEAKLNLLSGTLIHKHTSYFWKRFLKVKVLKLLQYFCSQHFWKHTW